MDTVDSIARPTVFLASSYYHLGKRRVDLSLNRICDLTLLPCLKAAWYKGKRAYKDRTMRPSGETNN